jgi:hypothetical protein
VFAVLFIVELSRLSGQPERDDGDRRLTPSDHAEALLRDVLDDREYRQLKERGYLDVRSPADTQRIYRVPAYAGLVLMFERGVAACQLCLQPVDALPGPDLIVMHKLMIEGDEPEYLRRARQHQPMQPNQRYRP